MFSQSDFYCSLQGDIRDRYVATHLRKSNQICGEFLFNHALQFYWVHAHIPDGINIDGIRIFVVVMYQLE